MLYGLSLENFRQRGSLQNKGNLCDGMENGFSGTEIRFKINGE